MVKDKNLGEKILKGSVAVLTLTFLGSIFAYLIRIIFSRTLSVESYGLFYAVLGLFNVLTTYIDLGYGYSVVYLLPKYIREKNYKEAWNVFIHGQTISLTITLLVSVLLIIFAPFLSNNYFRVPGSENLIYIFCIYLISYVILNGLIQIFASLQQAAYFASITVSKWLLTLIISAVFLGFGVQNVIVFAIALAVAHLLTAIIYSYLLIIKHPLLIKNKVTIQKSTYKKMTAFALPAILETLVYSAVIATDTFLLTLFRGVRDVGIYNIIYPLASIPVVLFNPLNGLILPLVSHLMEGDKKRLSYLLEKILEVIPFISFYFILFIVIFPSAIVRLIFGDQWNGLVGLPLSILSPAGIPILMSGILGAILLGTGRVMEKLKAASLIAVVGIVLNTFLIWKYGLLGAVITSTFVATSLTVYFTVLLKQTIDFKVPFKFYLKIISFGVLLFVTARLLGLNPLTWTSIISYGVIYSLLYLGLGWILKVYDKKLLAMLLKK